MHHGSATDWNEKKLKWRFLVHAWTCSWLISLFSACQHNSCSLSEQLGRSRRSPGDYWSSSKLNIHTSSHGSGESFVRKYKSLCPCSTDWSCVSLVPGQRGPNMVYTPADEPVVYCILNFSIVLFIWWLAVIFPAMLFLLYLTTSHGLWMYQCCNTCKGSCLLYHDLRCPVFILMWYRSCYDQPFVDQFSALNISVKESGNLTWLHSSWRWNFMYLTWTSFLM